MEYGSSSKTPDVGTPLATSSDQGNDAAYALKVANIFYMGVFIVAAIISFILYNTGSSWLGKIITTKLVGVSNEASLVARTTSSLAIWFLVHSIITFRNRNLTDSCQFMFHISWKWLHALVYICLWIGFWFIPDDFFNYYMKIAIFVSALYLIVQIIFLIDFFHTLNDKWVTGDNDCVMLIITIVLGVGALVTFGLAYWMYKDVKYSAILISVNMCLTILLFVASIFIEHASIFTSSLVAVYIAYLTWAGIMCQAGGMAHSPGIWYSIIASIFTLVWAGYSAFSASNQLGACSCSDEEDDPPEFSLSFFHLMYFLASIYLTMIVTHWGQADTDAPWMTERGNVAVWVNMGSAWLVMLLYGWTLIAPAVCPNRDFS